jgi:hypothetical protein
VPRASSNAEKATTSSENHSLREIVIAYSARLSQAQRSESRGPDLEANMNVAKNSEQIRLERRTSLYWRVTFDHPPLNIFGPETIPQLNAIVTALETDSDDRD